MKMKLILFLAIIPILNSQVGQAKELHRNPPRTWALTNATIHTEPGKTVYDGTVVIRDGIIKSVGKNVRIPNQASILDMDGKHIYAGFIESWLDVNTVKKDTSLQAHWNPNMRAYLNATDLFHPKEKSLTDLRKVGFTTAHIAPKGGIFQGTSGLVQLGQTPKILSNNWLGLVDSANPATTDITVEQKNLALGGSRNFTYQYKGAETAGSASLDVTLNHGTWLHYALGNLSSISSSTPSTHNGTNAFQVADSVDSTGHNVYVGITTDADDYNTTSHTSATNGKIHRVLKGSDAICPPLLPGTAATASMSFNVKRTFECPTGYVGRAYDATNNDTSAANLPRVLNNFGQNTGVSTAVKQEFLTPYYFSDGTVSLFGSEFMKVSNFNLSIDNGLTDKRYIGQYNKQIKNVVTGQRTYNIDITALVTDRRLFAELRNEDSFRSAMSNSNVQLLLEKSTGERIKLQFDDFMVSVANFPGPTDDRGPLEVTFSIMPIRKGTTIDTKTSWVMQG